MKPTLITMLYTADPKAREQRLGNQAKALRAAGQRPDHRRRCDEQHDPAVVQTRRARGVQGNWDGVHTARILSAEGG
jgi:hypothetical protein